MNVDIHKMPSDLKTKTNEFVDYITDQNEEIKAAEYLKEKFKCRVCGKFAKMAVESI
jgi:hypothetical protein